MKAFGSERENRKPRTKRERRNRIDVLAKHTYQHIGDYGEQIDYREELKMRCATEHLPYDSMSIEEALKRARGRRCGNGRA